MFRSCQKLFLYSKFPSMSVNLRIQHNKTGSKSLYLDIRDHGIRTRKYLGIVIQPDDRESKQKMKAAENIRLRTELQMIDGSLDLRPSPPLNEYFQQFLNSFDKAGRKKYQNTFNYLKGNSTRLKNLRHSDIQKFADSLSHLADNTRITYLACLKYVLKRAFRDDLIKRPIWQDVTSPKPKNQVIKNILTPDEIRTLYVTPLHDNGLKQAFILSCFTGIGYADAKSAKWDQLSSGSFMYTRSKTGLKVVIPLKPELKELFRSNSSDLIFPKLPHESQSRKLLMSWTDRAGISKHITFYCGRHTFACNLLLSGASLKTVADLLGHSSTRHTLKYLNFVDSLKQSAIDNLPGL